MVLLIEDQRLTLVEIEALPGQARIGGSLLDARGCGRGVLFQAVRVDPESRVRIVDRLQSREHRAIPRAGGEIAGELRAVERELRTRPCCRLCGRYIFDRLRGL